MIWGSGQEAWAHCSQYVNKDNPDKVLSTKEWKALPKEERGNYIKTESTKGVVERVSYAKVWGETAKDKSIGFQVYACILLFVHSLEAFYYFANPRSDSMRARKELKVDHIVCGFIFP